MAVSDPRDFFKGDPLMEAFFKKVDGQNWSEQQEQLASYEALAGSCKMFKDAGCQVALRTYSINRLGEARQWVGVMGTTEQIAAAYWVLSEDNEAVDCLIDLSMSLNEQYPINKDASLIPGTFVSAVERHDHEAFKSLSPRDQEIGYGNWTWINKKRRAVVPFRNQGLA